MRHQPPQWPDQPTQSGQPAHLTQPASGGSWPARFSSRSQLVLAVVAVVSSVLVVALLCSLLLVVLSSHARGTAGSAPGGQTQTATAGTGQSTATVAATGTSTPGSSGGSGDGTRHTPTPTPTPGPHAPPSVHQMVNQVTLSGTNSGPVVATCPSGELALSGGWAVPYTAGATILRSKRSGTRGWAISVGHAADVVATSYAECLANAPGAAIAERGATLSVDAGRVSSYKVPCNTGEMVVGGGFATQSGVNVLGTTADSVGSPYAWSVGFWNLGASLASYTVYVECLTYATAHSSANVSQLSPIAAGSTGGTTSPACPSGTQVSGGGYAYLSQATGFAYGMSAQRVLGDDGSSYIVWKALLYANGGQSVKLESLAVCLGFS